MTDLAGRETGSKPNVYFIDDSATMREVVKIAFRRENFNVVTCSDMASAVALFNEQAPDAVISDVIMPDKDGYQLCEFVKQHPLFGRIPVFLMSGVVNKEVAERAHEVKADELQRTVPDTLTWGWPYQFPIVLKDSIKLPKISTK